MKSKIENEKEERLRVNDFTQGADQIGEFIFQSSKNVGPTVL